MPFNQVCNYAGETPETGFAGAGRRSTAVAKIVGLAVFQLSTLRWTRKVYGFVKLSCWSGSCAPVLNLRN